MSKQRLDVHNIILKAVEKTGERYKVYYNPVSNIKLEYPCIIYRRKGIHQRHADDIRYHTHTSYQLTIIDKRVESPVVEKLLENQYCTYNNEFVSENMNHTIMTLNSGGITNG